MLTFIHRCTILALTYIENKLKMQIISQRIPLTLFSQESNYIVNVIGNLFNLEIVINRLYCL